MAVACNTTYTADPTACDDWCDATHGLQCEYDPAACVSQCEDAKAPNKADCSEARSAVMDCFLAHPEAKDFVCPGNAFVGPCWDVIDPLTECEAGLHRPSACERYCSSLASTVCPSPSLKGCILACENFGLSDERCGEKLEAAAACAAELSRVCDDSTSDSAEIPEEIDPETLPCKPERDALQDCAAHLAAPAEDAAAGAAGTL